MQQAKIDAQKIITVEGISDGKFKVGIFKFENLKKPGIEPSYIQNEINSCVLFFYHKLWYITDASCFVL